VGLIYLCQLFLFNEGIEFRYLSNKAELLFDDGSIMLLYYVKFLLVKVWVEKKGVFNISLMCNL